VADVNQCRLVALPRFQDHRGSLTVVEPDAAIPFEIRRAYYLYDTPNGAVRGGHGHRRLQQLIIALAGSLVVELDDGCRRQAFQLSSPDRGLYVCPMIWRTLRNFADGTVCLVLASERFDEADYFHNYDEFIAAAKQA
jgi:dTDP-4-dehydrorhamnose 3,5-epimerase-like enzyme